MSFFRSPLVRRIIYGIVFILAASRLIVALLHATPPHPIPPPHGEIESSRVG